MMKKVIIMSMIIGLAAVSANAAVSFSNDLKGFGPGDNFADPAILDGSGLESSDLPGSATDWEVINFDATGAIFGPQGNQGNWRGRNTLRTVEGDYNTTSFTATVTVNRNSPTQASVYFGMGTAQKAFRMAPDKIETTNASVIFELQRNYPNAAWGTNVDDPDPATSGNVGLYTQEAWSAMSGGTTGLMQLKMEFNLANQTAAFSIDYGADGTYEQQFAAYDVSAVLAEMAGGDRASIYFGSDNTNTMSDFSVVVVPEPATLALLGLGGLILRKRKQ